MSPDQMTRHTSRGERGFALILALLALMLLTMLGLTLATTTTTELQIATNYRYSQQAYYNAEAGIELGKRYLRDVDWRGILPPPRSAQNIKDGIAPTPFLTRTGPDGEASRNLELGDAGGCDPLLSGYGVVLDDPTEPFPFQNSSTALGQTLNGTFTLWVRRPTLMSALGDPYDDASDFVLILTAEGTAPYGQSLAGNQAAMAKRAVRYLEVDLQREPPGGCQDDRGPQAGGGPSGANFDQCDPIREEGVLGGAVDIAPTDE